MNHNHDIENTIRKFENDRHMLEYVPGVLPIEYDRCVRELEDAFHKACRNENELLIRVNYPFIHADQIAVKLICELYETLDANRFLCAQLSKKYKTRYVLLYKSITQNISVNEVIRHTERQERETASEASLRKKGGMDWGLDYASIKAELNAASEDAVINALKKRNVVENTQEKSQQTTPVPLDVDSATRALDRLIHDLAGDELNLYSEHVATWWNAATRLLDSKDTVRSVLNLLLKPLGFLVSFVLWAARFAYQGLQLLSKAIPWRPYLLGKKKIRVLFTLRIDEEAVKASNLRKQIETIAINQDVACVVFT